MPSSKLLPRLNADHVIPDASRSDPVITRIDVSAYTIPTDYPEADGTLDWNETTLVLVDVWAADHHGLGFTYGDAACATLIKRTLADLVSGQSAMAVTKLWWSMLRAVRNAGRPGIAAMALSAVDTALWDLKARLLNLPLVTLLGAVRSSVSVYGSGGFTSYPADRLQEQLAAWVADGIPRVKMKVGRSPVDDPARVRAARRAIGGGAELFVDANGAYTPKQALHMAERFEESRVRWFEEPVSSDDLKGLRLVRRQAPASMEIAAGEYIYDLHDARRLLEAGAVDVLQADVTRCAGITGFLKVGALCEAFAVPLSAHCAPSLHVHPCCATDTVRHLEYFHDHVRIEQILFEGAPVADKGLLAPDLTRPGLGLEFKRQDAKQYEV